MKKFYYSQKLRYYTKLHKEANIKMRLIENLFAVPNPTYHLIKVGFGGMYWDMYNRLVEQAYDLTIKEANCMLKMENYEAYKEQCEIIKMMDSEIWKMKSA